MPSALLPESFVTTRLRAERMSQTHLPFITAMHADAALMATMGGTRDAASSRRYVQHNLLHWAEQGYGMYVLTERDSGALAGRAGLKLAVSGKVERVEIAYAFQAACWGRGYASEITRVLLALGFERLPVQALSAVAVQANAASLRVMQKCGLRWIETTGEGEACKLRYEIRREQWLALASAAGQVPGQIRGGANMAV
ncbi:GNAT family N-acetyltransferase [Achromobacter sp. UMC71]|uniref:GNAT family N-acetyltransferase n=1 Tax=Achromobacter sp. UMC71 TaxID=1862320 RepID=UPI0016019238|nr:GNAT family N-acetyltransferase [Achromobacter sp. UMC71]MBB1626742.1 GNAT family acetyltransferase [Achromobacter sp. UMC71]